MPSIRSSDPDPFLASASLADATRSVVLLGISLGLTLAVIIGLGAAVLRASGAI